MMMMMMMVVMWMDGVEAADVAAGRHGQTNRQRAGRRERHQSSCCSEWRRLASVDTCWSFILLLSTGRHSDISTCLSRHHTDRRLN